MLTLTSAQLQQIQAHAERTYPEECCGILLGTLTRQADSSQKMLVHLIETINAWSESVAAELEASLLLTASRYADEAIRRDRYWIDPKILLQAQKYARDHSLAIIGIYHSHPDHPAAPSETDRRLAWAEYSYVIVSVQAGKTTDTRCWQLNDQQFQVEELVISDAD
jgi:proteasome lid subunit RPN8/RPN11